MRAHTIAALAALAVAALWPAARADAQGPAPLQPTSAPERPARGTAPLPTPPRFADVRLSTGVRLRVAEQGAPDGEPVILLHGYSDSWFSYSRVLPLFPARYRVFALDQRGHGDSERPASGYHMRDLAADVLAFMDAKGIVRATIVGHSMGSWVAQQVALAAPQRVSRLVLVGSSRAPRTFVGMDELAKAVAELGDSVPETFVREFQVSTVHAPVPPEFMDRAVAESRKLPARVWRALMDGMLATEPPVALGRAGIPTLLVRGEHDAFATGTEQEALLAMLRTARIRTVAGTGHAPHWERPDEFMREVLAFLAEGSVSQAPGREGAAVPADPSSAAATRE